MQRAAGRRILLGITGQPGAGKSTIAERLVADLGERAVLVPMDGFHLPQATLVQLERRARMGAPDTFDVRGYATLLERLRTPAHVTSPGFDRTTEEPVAGAIEIPPGALIVVTEGNYLLADSGGWGAVRPQLDAVWYVEVDDAVRLERLIARHEAFGKSPEDAAAWANGPDAANAVVIASTRDRADRVISGD
jgi:pantothenate kinase